MRKLLAKVTARRSTLAAHGVEVNETTGQVCTRSCRSAAHRDRVKTSAYRARI